MWSEILGSITFVGVAAALDKVMLLRHRSMVHDRLTRYWLRLDATELPDIPVVIAQKTLNSILRSLGGNWLSVKAMSRYFLVSFALTCLAVALGLLLYQHWYSAYVGPSIEKLIEAAQKKPHDKSSDDVRLLFIAARSFHPTAFPFHHPMWFVTLVTFNLLFDMASIGCTLYLLDAIVKHGSAYAWLVIAAIFCVSIGCALASFTLGFLVSFEAGRGLSSGSVAERGAAFVSWIVAAVVTLPYSLTSLVPTMTFLAVLALGHAVKVVLNVSRHLGLALLERATEDKPESSMPATILASGLWIMLAAAWGLWAIGGLLSKAGQALARLS